MNVYFFCSGLRLSPSLGAIEVIVKSTVDPHDSSDEDQEDGQGHTVFLHLKKFFRGARFTNAWFLNKMAAKYPIHAQVAVGGKVRLTPAFYLSFCVNSEVFTKTDQCSKGLFVPAERTFWDGFLLNHCLD